LKLLRPTQWLPTEVSDVPIQALARVQRTIYATPSFAARIEESPRSTDSGGTFLAHVQTLEPWAQQLLSNITWILPLTNVCQILASLPLEIDLLIVSDGSSIENQHMSFGVTIGTLTGQILVEIQGPATGPTSSHRAECTGCLAGALFCYALKKFTQQKFSHLSIVAVSDNQGMIKSMTNRMSYTNVYPNSTLHSDWDLIEETVSLYRRLETHRTKFEWVKGHQDDGPSDHELSTQA
jgi:ribonuclease HI